MIITPTTQAQEIKVSNIFPSGSNRYICFINIERICQIAIYDLDNSYDDENVIITRYTYILIAL